MAQPVERRSHSHSMSKRCLRNPKVVSSSLTGSNVFAFWQNRRTPTRLFLFPLNPFGATDGMNLTPSFKRFPLCNPHNATLTVDTSWITVFYTRKPSFPRLTQILISGCLTSLRLSPCEAGGGTNACYLYPGLCFSETVDSNVSC